MLTENTQPAILAVSIAACRLVDVARRARRRSSRATASASTRRTSRPARYRFADALRMVRRRGRYMQEAVPVGDGRDGGDPRARRRRRRAGVRRGGATGEVVSPANLNGAGQVVIAGARDAVARAGERAKALGREARRFRCR